MLNLFQYPSYHEGGYPETPDVSGQGDEILSSLLMKKGFI